MYVHTHALGHMILLEDQLGTYSRRSPRRLIITSLLDYDYECSLPAQYTYDRSHRVVLLFKVFLPSTVPDSSRA